MRSFHSKTDITFILQLITFEPLELKQSYIPHLKVLMNGINALDAKRCGYIFVQCNTHLNLALSIQKTVFVTFLLASTVFPVVCFIICLLPNQSLCQHWCYMICKPLRVTNVRANLHKPEYFFQSEFCVETMNSHYLIENQRAE